MAHLKSQITYSRDALARLLYVLRTVLDAIRLGELFSDRTRSAHSREFEPVIMDEQGSPNFWEGPLQDALV